MSTFHWGYKESNGPTTWPEHFPAGKGDHQSPVNIAGGEVEFDPELESKALQIDYAPATVSNVTNTGNGFQVNYDQSKPATLTGGPLSDKFQLLQFHFHWGADDSRGSEHTVNGQCYAAEMHLVHWNTSQFTSPGDALSSPNGLAVLGLLIKVGQENAELDKVLKRAEDVKHCGEECCLNDTIDLNKIVPADVGKYWTYSGSLTTPPLWESVNWIVVQTPIEMSSQQLAAFRQLVHQKRGETEEGKADNIVDNFRPPQPLGSRKVKSSCPAH